MAQFITFFERQTVFGGFGGSGQIYSDVYDVSEAKTIKCELKAYAASGQDTCDVRIQGTDDPTFAGGFEDLGNGFATTGQSPTPASETLSGSDLRRFIRAEMQPEEGKTMMVGLTGRANC